MVQLVDLRIDLQRIVPFKTDHEKIALQRQIDAMDRQIDQLGYELYGLSQEFVWEICLKVGE